MAAYIPHDAGGPRLPGESRYAQLCDALEQSRIERAARREECFAFIERTIHGLIEHLEIPSELVLMAPPDGPPGRELTIGAATRLSDDGFWQTGVHLKIEGKSFGSPSLIVALVLHVKKQGDGFLFKLTPDGLTLHVSDDRDADASEVHEFVFRRLLDSLRFPA